MEIKEMIKEDIDKIDDVEFLRFINSVIHGYFEAEKEEDS